MWKHEIFFPRSDPKEAAWTLLHGCLTGIPGSATTQVDLWCKGNTDHPQTRGNAAALVMPQLLMGDHKSHEDHGYIWQPG